MGREPVVHRGSTENKFDLLNGYEFLRPLSLSSRVYLCRENATGRLLVIKKNLEASETDYFRELRALTVLSQEPFVPQLYFATQRYLGSQYFPGQSFASCKEDLSKEVRRLLGRHLMTVVHDLHHRLGWTHGDISPKNCLFRLTSAGEGVSELMLVDWEYSQPLNGDTLATYAGFCGTVGFASTDTSKDRIARDEEALKATLKFIDAEDVFIPVEKRKTEKKRWRSWISVPRF